MAHRFLFLLNNTPMVIGIPGDDPFGNYLEKNIRNENAVKGASADDCPL